MSQAGGVSGAALMQGCMKLGTDMLTPGSEYQDGLPGVVCTM